MKAVSLAVILMALITTVYASSTVGLTPWVYIGSSTTFLGGDYVDELENSGSKVDNFEGTIVGLRLNKQWENNLIFGVTLQNTEKGYIVNDVASNQNYIEGILSFGYCIDIPSFESLSFLPYVSLGMATPYNASCFGLNEYMSMHLGLNVPIGVGWMAGVEYSIGFQDAIKNKDSKYNSLNVTLGHRF